MRAFALAAVAASLALIGTAAARPWNDPAGRVTFDAPNGWTTSQPRGATQSTTLTYVISGTANNECQVFAFDAADTASITADRVRRHASDPANFAPEFWARTLNSIPAVFPENSAQILSTSVDTSGAWPIQRAETRNAERPVHAAMHMRPGFNTITLCMTYDGAEPTAVYDAFIRSVAHPNDAALTAAADQQASERAAQTNAPAPQPEPPQEQSRRNGNRQRD